MIDKQKESEFYKKSFKFSYSSLNKLLFSPTLFYKDYILLDKEERTEKHLIEGKLIHCLLFEPNNLEDKFKILPEKTPSDNVRKILHKLFDVVGSNQDLLENTPAWDSVILQVLINQNLYQSLKKDEARIAKIKTNSNDIYWKFISNSLVDVIDIDTLNKCKDIVNLLLENDDVAKTLLEKNSDFALDPVKSYTEKKLDCNLKNYKFGLKGIVDHYKIDDENKTVTICDLKTTGKTITDFEESVEFWNYWLQAAIYSKLVYENHKDECDNYKILFKFIVIDKYKQVYIFDVSEPTIQQWVERLDNVLKVANYHYTNAKYNLPYKFLVDKVVL
jgi:hypothetical protein